MVLPASKSSRLSNTRKISYEGWWIAQRTVTPRPDKPLRMLTMSVAAAESRPLVGSSQSRSWGRPPMIARPTLRRLFSPPEIPRSPWVSSPIGVPAQASNFKTARISSTRFWRSSAGVAAGNRSSAAKPSISRGVRALRKTSCCGTTLATSRIYSGSTKWPLTKASPSNFDPGEERPLINVNKEVLPEPLAPMMADSFPGGKTQETPNNTVRGGTFLELPATV
mmetsp:Transcript_44413/g.127257  ORF Transcript_44413/g.127257 Transcript_44413/m.127257 type:complete len:223 (+) Transcript_44413:1240-1908(+)